MTLTFRKGFIIVISDSLIAPAIFIKYTSAFIFLRFTVPELKLLNSHNFYEMECEIIKESLSPKTARFQGLTANPEISDKSELPFLPENPNLRDT